MRQRSEIVGGTLLQSTLQRRGTESKLCPRLVLTTGAGSTRSEPHIETRSSRERMKDGRRFATISNHKKS